MAGADGPRARRRAGLTLTGIVVLSLAVLAVLAGMLVARDVTGRDEAAAPGAGAEMSPPDSSGVSRGEARLARRPMLQLPVQAAQPQPLNTDPARPAITLPQPQTRPSSWIPGSFPGTAEGALAQLAALTETAMTGGDPAVYARGYAQVAAPGAPDPRGSGLYRLLRSFREHAGLLAFGPVPNMTVSYEVTHGQIKGTGGDGGYVVACVLGQISADVNGQVVTAGAGDCQAMRWSGTRWRIAASPRAATAPSAWPGSPAAVRAGYQEVRQP